MSISRLRLCALATLVFFCLSLLYPVQARAFFFGGVTLKDENEMGRKFDVAVRSNLPMVEDPEISQYVNNLVAHIVSSIPPQPFRFKPGVILHPSINAFAVPGGYIYVFTGLLMNFNSEEEVAGVLCHELAHVTQRHVASRLERAQMISIGSLLLAVAGIAVGGGGAAAAGALGAGQAAMLDYSRADETEADQIGMQFLIKAGYPPIGMVNGFKVLRQKSWMMGVSVPAYLSTHPDIGDRINGIQARILNMPKAITARKTDNRRFKRMQILLWGRYYAFWLLLEKTFLYKTLDKSKVIGHVYTIVIVTLVWPLFKLEDMGIAWQYTSAMLGFGAKGFICSDDIYYLLTYAATFAIGILASTPLAARLWHRLPKGFVRVAAPALILLALVLSTAYLDCAPVKAL